MKKCYRVYEEENRIKAKGNLPYIFVPKNKRINAEFYLFSSRKVISAINASSHARIKLNIFSPFFQSGLVNLNI